MPPPTFLRIGWQMAAAILLIHSGSLRAPAAEPLTVAAASSLAHCIDDLQAAFVRTHPGIKVQTTLGSSGTLVAQIIHGAPYDVFLSADMNYPAALIRADQAVGPTPTAYARGRLALWTLSPTLDFSDGLSSLTQARTIAIAQPEHAPYGVAARQALKKAGLWEKLQPRIVYGENVAQAAHFIVSGNAEAGLVAASLLQAPAYAAKGRHKILTTPGPLQGTVLTRRARHNPAAQAYLKFLHSPEAQKILTHYNFIPTPTPPS